MLSLLHAFSCVLLALRPRQDVRLREIRTRNRNMTITFHVRLVAPIELCAPAHRSFVTFIRRIVDA